MQLWLGISTQSARSNVKGSLLRARHSTGVSTRGARVRTPSRPTHAMRTIRSRLSALFILNAPGSYSSKVEPVEKKSDAASSDADVM